MYSRNHPAIQNILINMKNWKKLLLIVKVLQTLMYIAIALISPFILYCFTGKIGIVFFSIILIFAIIFSAVIIKQKTNNLLDTMLKYIPLPLILFIGSSFFILRASNNSSIIKFIEILGDKVANFLNFLVNSPEFYCSIICNTLTENMVYTQLIIFFIIALLPLYSIYKTSLKIIDLWSR